MTNNDRALLRRAFHKGRRGSAKRVQVTIADDTLKRIDRYARKVEITRSAPLVAGADAIMKRAG